jgi:hypothetical protein
MTAPGFWSETMTRKMIKVGALIAATGLLFQFGGCNLGGSNLTTLAAAGGVLALLALTGGGGLTT